MFVPRVGQMIVLPAILVFACVVPVRALPAQTPRQAILEMFSGGDAPFKKHLTVEMRRKLDEMTKDSPSGTGPFQLLTSIKTSDPDAFQEFDLGSILFSFNDLQKNERYEVRINSEEQHGDQDIMELSLHLVRNAIEQELPVGLRFVLNLKKQEGLWRLDAVTLSTTLPFGDPKMLENSWWGPAVYTALIPASADQKPTIVMDERPKLSPLRAVRMIGMSENI